MKQYFILALMSVFKTMLSPGFGWQYRTHKWVSSAGQERTGLASTQQTLWDSLAGGELVSGRPGSGLQTDVLAGGLRLSNWPQAGSECPSSRVVGGWCREDSQQAVLTMPCSRAQGLASMSWEEREGKNGIQIPEGYGTRQKISSRKLGTM